MAVHLAAYSDFWVCFYFNRLSRSHEGTEGESVRESKNSLGNSIAGTSTHSAHQCAAFLCLAECSVAECTVDVLRVWPKPCWRFKSVSQWSKSEDTDSEDLLNVQVKVLIFISFDFVLKPSDKQPSQSFWDLKMGTDPLISGTGCVVSLEAWDTFTSFCSWWDAQNCSSPTVRCFLMLLMIMNVALGYESCYTLCLLATGLH